MLSTVVLALLSASAGINGTELDTPEAGRFPGNNDAPLGEEVFDIPMAQIESVVEPDCAADDVGWESVALICIYGPILSISAS